MDETVRYPLGVRIKRHVESLLKLNFNSKIIAILTTAKLERTELFIDREVVKVHRATCLDG